MAIENVIAQNQRARVIADKIGADMEGLRETVGAGLYRVAQRHAEIRTIAQYAAELILILRGGDNQNVANACNHERGERIVDHWLVIDRHELFRDATC